MPSFKELYPKERLSGEDLVYFEAGKKPRILRPKVTIDKVIVRNMDQSKEMGGGKKPKLLCYFVGKKKYVILNESNCKALLSISGTEDYEKWKGLECILTAYEKEVFKQMKWIVDIQPVDNATAPKNQSAAKENKAATAKTQSAPQAPAPPVEEDSHPEDLVDIPTDDDDEDLSSFDE